MTSSLLARLMALLGKGNALNTKGHSSAGRGREQAIPTVWGLGAGEGQAWTEGTEQ